MTVPVEKTPIPPLEVRLLGGFDVRVEGGPLPPLRSRREQWLLALLVLRQDRDTGRNWLATTLWPDNEEEKALFYLRKSLSNLRQALKSDSVRLLSPTPRTVRLDLAGAFADVVAFDSALKRASGSADPSALLQEAITLYRGPLLADCPEEWAAVERNQREQAYLGALEALATHLQEQGEPASAVHWLRLLIAADPYRESASVALMQALADCGDLAAVRVVYQDLRTRLRQELNATPAPETEALFRQLSQQEKSAPTLPAQPTTPRETRRHLPVPLSDLIGRETEIAEVGDWLTHRRLVTLLGAGGVGKTRLAIAVAEATLPQFDDGVWFVDLAALSDALLVPQTTAKALGIREERHRPLTETLTEALAERSLLLVLDNCEHLLEACADLAYTLLSSCPLLRIVATSRQALDVMGEQVYRVPSLLVPPNEHTREGSVLETPGKDPHFLMEYEAVRLFMERAVRVNSGFLLHQRNASSVVEICRQLDGIPLAIEMAAARLRSLSVSEINARLEDRFRLLTSGNRGVLPRHQTLRAAIDWSYDQLAEAERTLLCRLSVFVGGWTAEAAEGICGDTGDDIPEILTSLVDKSLVVRQDAEEGGSRYRLLETVRQYAREHLEALGQQTEIRQRHRDYYLALAEEADAKMQGPEEQACLDLLEAEHDNLRAALQGTGEAELHLASLLGWFWMMRSHVTEGRAHFETILKRHGDSAPSPVIARVFHAAGNLAFVQSDYVAARRYFERAATMRNILGEYVREASSRTNLATVSQEEEDYTTARDQYLRSLEIQKEFGDNKAAICVTLTCLGNVHRIMGELPIAQDYLEQAIELHREIGNHAGEANALNLLGLVCSRKGDKAAAQSAYNQSLAIHKEMGIPYGMAENLINLGYVLQEAGELTEAASHYAESLSLYFAVGSRKGIAESFDTWAGLEIARGFPVRAAHLLGASDKILSEMTTRRSQSRSEIAAITSTLREALGDAEFDAEFERGRAMTLEQAVALALQGVNG